MLASMGPAFYTTSFTTVTGSKVGLRESFRPSDLADRTRTGSHHDASFSLFIVFGCVNSCYSLTWDILMDWDLLKRNARHRFLRNELAYSHHWVSAYPLEPIVHSKPLGLNLPSTAGLLRGDRGEFTLALLLGTAFCAARQSSVGGLHHRPNRDFPTLALERECVLQLGYDDCRLTSCPFPQHSLSALSRSM
jgi:hypothetical protein